MKEGVAIRKLYIAARRNHQQMRLEVFIFLNQTERSKVLCIFRRLYVSARLSKNRCEPYNYVAIACSVVTLCARGRTTRLHQHRRTISSRGLNGFVT